MSRQEQIERVYEQLWEVPDDMRWVTAQRVVDAGIGDFERFEVDCKIRDEFANWIGVRPKDYKGEG